jgi:hypothetical protein
MSCVIIHENGEETSDTVAHKTYGTLQHTWKTPTYEIHLYAKKRGKAGTENKFEFPPPMDTPLLFGKCLLMNPAGDLTLEMWREFYESTMQFEDIEASECESEDEVIEGGEYTNGYLKDDFVVSDNELEEEAYKN